jgi:putative PIN family toxin of toxin-antitoxin system
VVLEELRDVLTRPKTQARFPKATSQVVDAFLQHFANLARFEKSVPRKFTSTRDPKDEPYINLALVAKATYVVSRDKDLLDLMRWDTDEGRDFQKRFRTIKVVSPEAFLDIVEAL